MNGILGFSDLLKTSNLTGEKQQEYISLIENSGKRMLNIINDIVNISKVESGIIEVNLSQSNANEQIEYIYNFFKTEIENKGIKLILNNSLTHIEAQFKTDREKVFAILTNLVKNAVKFTNKGVIEIGYVKKGKFLEFFVKDTGAGIRKEHLEIIFERFRQGSEELNRGYEGAGLGLSISKAYVEILGGNIWVESEQGKGSTFYFTIPYNIENKLNKVIENNIPVSKEKNLINKLKILIAEDDLTSEKLATINVWSYSKNILIAKNGLETVQLCRNHPDIDLILMDMKMPELNGNEATKQIRQFNKNVIIIAQTAYAFSGDRENSIEAGCNDYISKPIIKEELHSLILKYFK
jgi:CheY-like chemotaxis protein